MRKFTKRAATVAVAAVALTGVGVGYAVWTNVTDPAAVTGAVDSNGNTLTLSTSGVLPTDLGQTEVISVSAANVTQTEQELNTLTGTLTAPGCTIATEAVEPPTTDFTVVDNTDIAPVAAGASGVAQGSFSVTLNNLPTTNQDSCQGSALSFAVDGE